jgi:hypothetical protein
VIIWGDMAAESKCARERLAEKFQNWLSSRYTPMALQFVDKEDEAKIWVAEIGSFVPGTGQCIWEKCERCGQFPRVLGDGNASRLMSEPVCEVRDGIYPVAELT